jgi:alkylation response protein AidB-like acyl-CoA dehydrogenase
VDFGFSPEQEMLRESARKLLEAECPSSLVRAMTTDATAHAPALWRHLADLGLLGILVPAEHGGQGGSFLDLVVVLEEMGKVLLPGPFFATTVLGGLAIALGGTAAQRAAWLPGLAAGERRMALALGEETGTSGADGVQLAAVTRGDAHHLQGTKTFVMDAHVADLIVVAARTSGTGEAGITLFAIDPRNAGVEIDPRNAGVEINPRNAGVEITTLRTVDMTRRLCHLRLDLTVQASAVIGDVDGGWPIIRRVLQHAETGLAVEAVGAAQRALDLSVAYANERKQFGRPIGSFQAIKHKCVDMMVAVETARSLAYYAAWAVSENAPDVAQAVAMAKAYASDVAKTVTSEAIQVHGGIGFTWEHDAHLYHRRALASAAAFGSAVEHRETVARALVG